MVRFHLPKGLLRLLTGVAITIMVLVGLFLIPKYHERSIQNLNSHREDAPYIILDLEIRSCSVQSLEGCKASGDWFRVPKQLNYRDDGKPWSEFTKQYLFVKKKKIDYLKSDDLVMVDFEVSEDAGGGVVPDHLWKYKKAKYDKAFSSSQYYYNVDVLFGLDAIDPRPDWELLKDRPLTGIDGDIPVYLTFRRTKIPRTIEKPKIKASGEYFKILQVADLHFSTHEGVCRDQFPEVDDCKADKRTLKFVNKVLDIEEPDLVVLTGDQIFGDESFDSVTTILKVTAPFIEKKIPFAMMFGNHDDEGSLTREEIMDIVKDLPYSISVPGPKYIDGVGNYVFQVEKESEPIMTFFILDSHKYSQAPKVNPGYDWIKENQLEYIKDLRSVLNMKSPNHLSFGFFHIPLPEYRKAADVQIYGSYKESVMAPRYNTHTRDVMAELGVQVISVGHDHCNDYCLLDTNDYANNSVWLCYGGGAGEGGYGGYGGTTRRLRIFEVEIETSSVRSYKRLESAPEETFDHQILVNNINVI